MSLDFEIFGLAFYPRKTETNLLSKLKIYSIEGESTIPIPCDAEPATMKGILQNLNSIGTVDISRSEVTPVGGYTWTISFLEDSTGTHRGDVPELVVISSLHGGSGIQPSIVVDEARKGTVKEVQRISIAAGGASVDPLSSFRLEFQGQSTENILALPLGGTTCLGSTVAKQLITTSTIDTSTAGGDDSVSPFTTFTISYKEFVTSPIHANAGPCSDAAGKIALELSKLPPLQNVVVHGKSTGAGDGGCEWEINLLSVTGNPDLMKGKKRKN